MVYFCKYTEQILVVQEWRNRINKKLSVVCGVIVYNLTIYEVKICCFGDVANGRTEWKNTTFLPLGFVYRANIIIFAS